MVLGGKAGTLLLAVLLGCRSEVKSPSARDEPSLPGMRADAAPLLDDRRDMEPMDAAPGTVRSPSDAMPGSQAMDDAATGTGWDAQTPVACEAVPQGSESGRAGPPSGLVFCEDGTHFVEQLPQRCERIGEDWTEWDSGRPVPCGPHIDCSSRMCDPVDGRCVRLSECTVDDDCDEGEACVCSGPVWHQYPRCLPADCRAGSDCASGSCGLSSDHCGSAESTHCHTERDLCRFNADCGYDEDCRFVEGAGRWECVGRTICE